MNGFIVLFVGLSCRVGWSRSTLRLYSHWVCSTNKFREIREIRAKLIVNRQFSIFNCFAPLLASLIVNCPFSIVN